MGKGSEKSGKHSSGKTAELKHGYEGRHRKDTHDGYHVGDAARRERMNDNNPGGWFNSR